MVTKINLPKVAKEPGIKFPGSVLLTIEPRNSSTFETEIFPCLSPSGLREHVTYVIREFDVFTPYRNCPTFVFTSKKYMKKLKKPMLIMSKITKVIFLKK